METLLVIVDIFCALYIRQLLINRKLEKIILKYFIQYGFLPYDNETPSLISNIEERANRISAIKSKLNGIISKFKRK